MSSRRATLLVNLIVLSLSVQNALTHLNGHTSASADAAKRLCGRRPTHQEVEDFLKRFEGVKPITQKLNKGEFPND